jgi:hypothetical protein
MRRRQPPKTSTPARIAAEWPKGTPVGEIYAMVRGQTLALDDIAIQAGKMG